MVAEATGLFLLLVSFALTFIVARFIGNRFKARRDAEAARAVERDLAMQSRQVRRAAARKRKA